MIIGIIMTKILIEWQKKFNLTFSGKNLYGMCD